MARVYQELKNKTVVILKPSEVANTPGAAIIKKLGGANFDDLFNGFCAYFRQNGGWNWTGAPITPDSGAILDGEPNARLGQCVAFARAFRLLAITNKPYGLGITEALVGDPGSRGKYAGRYSNGFISTHPLGGVFGLQGNVWSPAPSLPPTAPLAPLYCWGDHKTVPFDGRFYDPSYGKIYNKLSDMATYHLRPEDDRKLDLSKHRVIEADDRSGSVWYFVALSQALCNQLQKTNCLQGPYRKKQDVPPALLS